MSQRMTMMMVAQSKSPKRRRERRTRLLLALLWNPRRATASSSLFGLWLLSFSLAKRGISVAAFGFSNPSFSSPLRYSFCYHSSWKNPSRDRLMSCTSFINKFSIHSVYLQFFSCFTFNHNLALATLFYLCFGSIALVVIFGGKSTLE